MIIGSMFGGDAPGGDPKQYKPHKPGLKEHAENKHIATAKKPYTLER